MPALAGVCAWRRSGFKGESRHCHQVRAGSLSANHDRQIRAAGSRRLGGADQSFLLAAPAQPGDLQGQLGQWTDHRSRMPLGIFPRPSRRRDPPRSSTSPKSRIRVPVAAKSAREHSSLALVYFCPPSVPAALRGAQAEDSCEPDQRTDKCGHSRSPTWSPRLMNVIVLGQVDRGPCEPGFFSKCPRRRLPIGE